MIPRPPVWMRNRITSLPNPLYSAVSTVMSPVTHTAEVAVKNASMNPSLPGPFHAAGRKRRIVPTAISTIK